MKDNDGETALHKVCWVDGDCFDSVGATNKSKEPIVKLLIGNGTNINAKYND